MQRKWIFIIVGVAALGAAFAYLLWGGLEENLVYFVTPSELTAKGEAAVGSPVRLGGMVERGSIATEGPIVKFRLTDGTSALSVVTTETPPQMFQEEMGVVVEGALTAEGVFTAERLMLKHGNEYRPPAEGELPTEVYRKLKRQQ